MVDRAEDRQPPSLQDARGLDRYVRIDTSDLDVQDTVAVIASVL